MSKSTADSYKIILKLDRQDRATPFNDPKERLQVAAYDTAIELLQSTLKFASKIDYKNTKNIYKNLPLNQPLDRIHNTIFINGERGSGKTAFMLNLKNAFEQNMGSEYCNEPSLYFCQPIDPTLLSLKEDFINVVIGQIHTEIETSAKAMSEDYINSLERVTDALESEFAAKNSYGVDKMLAFKGSLELERRLFDYFAAAKLCLNCKVIVLLIDDVDMSLDLAFNVLEVIRKYLACPYVLPIVSGDTHLYNIIVKRHFVRQLSINGSQPDNTERNKADLLATSYMQKIFPRHAQIKIEMLSDLLELQGTVGVALEDESPVIALTQFLQNIETVILAGASRARQPWSDFTPKSSRDYVQLANALNVLSKDEILTPLFTTSVTELKPLYRNEVLLKKLSDYFAANDLAVLSLAVNSSLQMFKQSKEVTKQPLLLRQIELFNLDTVTSEIQDPHSPRQLASDTMAQMIENKYSDADIKFQKSHFEQLPQLMLSFPPVEPVVRNLLVARGRVKALDNKQLFLLKLYSFDDYYSSYQSGHLIFFGKIFELIISSLYQDFDQNGLVTLLNQPPMHSFFHYFPTKVADVEQSEDNDDETDLDDNISEGQFTTLAEDINTWRSEYKLSKLGFSAQQILCLFNRYFTAVGVLKSKPYIAPQSLSKLHQRIKFILLNAVASYENSANRLVVQNIALNENFDAIKLIRSDHSFLQNVEPLQGMETLTNAISNHPIFLIEVGDDFPIKLEGKIPAESERIEEGPKELKAKAINAFKTAIEEENFKKLKNISTYKDSKENRVLIESLIEKIIKNEDMGRYKLVYRKQLETGSYFKNLYYKAEEFGLQDPLDKWLNE